ncbi:unnamed protein product [Dimorphilus gyrociliatus]|uniref:CBM21 domain-containing protein n=1 Tax=Dimorphilus gyrociliatus TaxID=2664684 RepID=A0A7I8VV79_9ANNE|nr:unnamed protein product [Dimorphilus gyrociliatus]
MALSDYLQPSTPPKYAFSYINSQFIQQFEPSDILPCRSLNSLFSERTESRSPSPLFKRRSLSPKRNEKKKVSKRRVSFADERGGRLISIYDKEPIRRLKPQFYSMSKFLVDVITDEEGFKGTVKSDSDNVTVRLTFDNWESYEDVQAERLFENSHTFNFDIRLPFHFKIGDSIEFAIRCQTTNGNEFWDNNDGLNYSLNYQVDLVN